MTSKYYLTKHCNQEYKTLDLFSFLRNNKNTSYFTNRILTLFDSEHNFVGEIPNQEKLDLDISIIKSNKSNGFYLEDYQFNMDGKSFTYFDISSDGEMIKRKWYNSFKRWLMSFFKNK